MALTDHMRNCWAGPLSPAHLVSPARLRAQVLDSRRSTEAGGWCTSGQAAAAAALAAVAEKRRAAEIAALERKLNETRQRHAEELARLTEVSESATSLEQTSAFQSDPHGSGAVLATRRRMFGRRAARLWVEDCATLGIARIHAMDEATGSRLHTDLPDEALSSMIKRFQLMKSRAKVQTRELDTINRDDSGDIDSFLQVLLDAVYVVGPLSPNGSLQLHLPTAFSQACTDSRGTAEAARWAQRWTSTSSNAPLNIARGADPYMAVAELEGMSRRLLIEDYEKAPPSGPLPSARGPQAPPAVPAPPGMRPAAPSASSARGTPSLRRSGPDGGGGYSAQRAMAVHSVMHMKSDEQNAAGTTPVTTYSAASTAVRSSVGHSHSVPAPSCAPARSSAAPLADRQPAARPPCRPATASAASTSKPSQRRPARPHSAPHGARRPQSARPRGRDQAAAEGCTEWRPTPPPMPPQDVASRDAVARRRRARPTSAKATKHRRVVDDGVDSIIYEDIEEETEETSEQWEAAIAGFQDATAAPTGPARSGTGGCGSCASSSRGGSLSSRSQSRSRHPGTRSHRSSEHSVERRAQSVEPDRREQAEAEANSVGIPCSTSAVPGDRVDAWSRPSSADARSEEISTSAFEDTALLKLSVTSGDGDLEEDVLNTALEEAPAQRDPETSLADGSPQPAPTPLPSQEVSHMTMSLEEAPAPGEPEPSPADEFPPTLRTASRRPHMPMSMSRCMTTTPVPAPPRMVSGASSGEHDCWRSFAETWPVRGRSGLHCGRTPFSSSDANSCAPELPAYRRPPHSSNEMGGAEAAGESGSACRAAEVAVSLVSKSSRLGSGPRASSPPPPPRFARSAAIT